MGQKQETELLAAGFPCIDVSRAGLRAGLQGKVCCSFHSSSVFQMLSDAPMPLLYKSELLISILQTCRRTCHSAPMA